MREVIALEQTDKPAVKRKGFRERALGAKDEKAPESSPTSSSRTTILLSIATALLTSIVAPFFLEQWKDRKLFGS